MDFKETRENIERLSKEIEKLVIRRAKPEASAKIDEAQKLLADLRGLAEKGDEIQERCIKRLTDDIAYYSEKLAQGGTIKEADSKTGFHEESELHRMGYQITGMERDRRWAILVDYAIPSMGIAEVVRTILNLMSIRSINEELALKNQHALMEWEYDVDRIIQEFKDAPELKMPDLQGRIKSVKNKLRSFEI